MKWRQFDNEVDAQSYCDEQTALMQLPPDQITTCWAEPMPLTDGSFVVPSYQDETAIAWDSSWVLQNS